MPVVMKGGTSGNRENDLPPDVGQESQPILDTSSNTNPTPGINWGEQPTGNRDSNSSPDVPTTGIPASTVNSSGGMDYKESTDYVQPDIRNLDNLFMYEDPDIFKGAPNKGMKLR